MGQYYIGFVTMPPTVMILNNRVANMERDAGVLASLPSPVPFMPDTPRLTAEQAEQAAF